MIRTGNEYLKQTATAKILICRADGGPDIGFGHWNRVCQLSKTAAQIMPVILVARNTALFLETFGNNKFIQVIEFTENYLEEFRSHEIVLAVDHYNVSESEWIIWRKYASLIIQIDDFILPNSKVDYIINPAPGIKPENYRKNKGWAAIYSGIDYRLISPVFERATPVNSAIRKKNVLISLGGSLQSEAWHSILNTFEKIKGVNLHLHLAGNLPNELNIKRLPFQVTTYQKLQQEELAELMTLCGTAILPPSNMALEYLEIGGCLITYKTAQNQSLLLQGLVKEKLAIEWSSEATLNFFEGGMDSISPGKLSGVNNSWQRFWEKVALHLEVRLVDAHSSHLELTSKWANTPEIRKYSFNSEPIPFSVHRQWFSRRIKKQDPYYIAYINDRPIGSCRFDLDEKLSEWQISYLVCPEMHGKGLGQVILSAGIRKLSATYTSSLKVTGKVLPNNLGSKAIFERLGFESIFEEESLKFSKNVI